MWLEDFVTQEWPSESWESWQKSVEAIEKSREESRKSAAWIKRTQKDEKKSKKYDDILSHYLVLFIRDKKYDSILKSLFLCLDKWYSSNFVLWILSLIYLPISNTIRELSWKNLVQFKYNWSNLIEFDDNNLDINIKSRINYWFDDIYLIMITEYSNINLKKVIELLKKWDSTVLNFTKDTFIFFLKENNISISDLKALSYAEFIVWEIYKKILKIDIKEI